MRKPALRAELRIGAQTGCYLPAYGTQTVPQASRFAASTVQPQRLATQ